MTELNGNDDCRYGVSLPPPLRSPPACTRAVPEISTWLEVLEVLEVLEILEVPEPSPQKIPRLTSIPQILLFFIAET